MITAEQISRMKHLAIVGNIGHFDNEIDMAGLAAMPGVTSTNIKPQVDRWNFPDGHSVIVLSEGRLLNLGNATGHPSFVMSTSFTNQVLACLLYTSQAWEVPDGQGRASGSCPRRARGHRQLHRCRPGSGSRFLLALIGFAGLCRPRCGPITPTMSECRTQMGVRRPAPAGWHASRRGTATLHCRGRVLRPGRLGVGARAAAERAQVPKIWVSTVLPAPPTLWRSCLLYTSRCV